MTISGRRGMEEKIPRISSGNLPPFTKKRNVYQTARRFSTCIQNEVTFVFIIHNAKCVCDVRVDFFTSRERNKRDMEAFFFVCVYRTLKYKAILL